MWFDVLQKKFQHKMVRGQIVLKDCPFCGNDRYNIEISIEKKVFHCWICDNAGTVAKLFKHIDLPMEDDGFKVSDTSVPKVQDTLSLAEYHSLSWGKARTFLKGRGLEEKDIVTYNFMTAEQGKFKDKIIVPLYEGEQLSYIIARDLTAKGRYYNVNINRSSVLPYYMGRSSQMYLCEGTFDAISVNKLGFSSAVLLGTVLSKEQMVKLEKWGFKDVVVCLDGDALDKATKMYDNLSKAGFKASVAIFYAKDDPNEVYVRDRAELKWVLKHPILITVKDRVRMMMKCK